MSKERLVPRLRFKEFEYNNHWTQKMVGEYYTFKNGLNKGKKYFGHGIPIVNYMDVFKTRRLYTENLKGKVDVSQSEQKNYSVLKGDIFFTRTSETLEEIGYPSVMLDSPEKAVFSGFVLRARPKYMDPLDIEFKSYVFYTKSFRNEMIKMSSMSTRALTSGTAIKKMKFKFPENIDEQKRIGNFFKKIDEIVQLQQSKVNKVKDIKSAYLSEMFPEEGEKYPRKRYEEFTEPWNKNKFNEITEYITSSLSANNVLTAGKYELYDANESIGYTNSFGQKQEYVTIIKDGSGVGRVRLLPKNSNFIGTMGAIVNKEQVDVHYIYAYLQQFNFTEFITGATVPHVYYRDYGESTDYHPSYKEQIKIGKLFKNLDKQISIEEEKLAKLEKLKQAYLNDMFV